MIIITIDREYGSAAAEIAGTPAARLGGKLLNRQDALHYRLRVG
jgi:hypothetical protein